MEESQPRIELLQAYLQVDVSARARYFKGFTQALKGVAADEGEEMAWAWAKRAVSPLLDYSSLMSLRRFLPPRKVGTGGESKLRLAILGGATTVQLRQLLEVFLAGEDVSVDIYEAEYGLFRQEILTPGSGLDAFRPGIVFIATGMRDVARYPAIDWDEGAVARLAAEEVADWVRLWETISSRWNATVLQNNFEIGPGGIFGHHALRHPVARENYLERLNRLFAEQSPGHVVLHDQRGLAVQAGAQNWFDPRFYLQFKMPCGPQCLVAYAYSIVSLLRAILGRSKKVLAIDLDNTIWGGIVGDLGAGGIRLGEGSGEGEAFSAFQKYLKELKHRGILLTVCSKNDDDKAREPFERREDMVLKLADICCFTANWQNKADNLRAMAAQLEFNLDAFVFIDDNPAERALVRRLLPEVAVPDMPEDPAGYIEALALHRYFEIVAFTREDTVRARYYAENAERRELAARSTDVNSFLASLDMGMKVSPVNELNVERATQLVNKSNQFNLTTRRYTTAQIREMATNPDWRSLTFSLRDKLGDNGIISVVLLRKHADALTIDTWVMSCRVLQRGVEQFVRNELIQVARNEDCTRLHGTYVPTAKNAMVKDHFERLGFNQVGSDGNQTFWSLSVAETLQLLDHHIEREANHE